MRHPRQGSAGHRARGFTLIEMIVVIAIIGLLSTIAVMKMGPTVSTSRATKIEADLRSIVTTAEGLFVLTGSYPTTLDDMVEPHAADGSPLPGLRAVPLDPWQAEYRYEVEPRGPVASCLGKDGAEGGEGDDKDHSFPLPQGARPAR